MENLSDTFKKTYVVTDDGFVSLTSLHWWQRDKDGWPIETYEGHPFKNFVRIICQNIRKVTG
jgi:hypothetical protein